MSNPRIAASVLRRARGVRLMAFDVDGVMTDGRLWYGPSGEQLKAFHVADGLGVKLIARAGVRTAILSARRSRALARRAAELGIDDLVMGAEDKREAFARLLSRARLQPADAGYMGDDLVDLPVLRRCGFAAAPATAQALVRRHVHYVARAGGGEGAVREVCELLLHAKGAHAAAMAEYLR